MRAVVFTLTILAGALPAAAQSALDGPLADPNAAPPKPAAAGRAKAKAKRPHHVAAKSAGAARPDAGPSDASVPAVPSAAAPAAAGDPVSLGMKWQGNNDSAAQTRYNNLDGSAFGSGAEVGMKLHF